MSSPKTLAVAASERRSGAAPGASITVDADLPTELLFEVLLLLPAKEVCRLRLVCGSWRTLTYNPLFVAAHAARHMHLAVRSYGEPGPCIDLMDLSGHVHKRTYGSLGLGDRVLFTRFYRVFVAGVNHSVCLRDPDTGSTSALPTSATEDLVSQSHWGCPAWFAFGQVVIKGEYKLLRIVEGILDGGDNDRVCEIFTLVDSTGRLTLRTEQWRQKESPPAYLDPSCTNGVVVSGAAYFLFDHWRMYGRYNRRNIEPGCIPSFNLETEQWSVALQGPLINILKEANGTISYADLTDRLMLAELRGFLVTVHCNGRLWTLDLWFLKDAENCVWSIEHRIKIDFVFRGFGEGVQALFQIDEEHIVLFLRIYGRQILWIYDPRTNSSTNLLEMGYGSTGVGIYTGSILG